MNANWRTSSVACFDALLGDRIVAIDMHTAGEPLRIVRVDKDAGAVGSARISATL